MTIKSFKVQDSLTVGSIGLKFAGSVADVSAKAAKLVQDADTKAGEIASIQGQISSLQGQLSYWQGIASGNPQNPLYGQAQGWITQLNTQIASLADNLDVLIKEYQVIQENIDVVNETLSNSVFRFPDDTVQTTAYTGSYTDLTDKPTIPTIAKTIIRAQRLVDSGAWTFTTSVGSATASFSSGSSKILITLTGFTQIPSVAQIFDNRLGADGGWRDATDQSPGAMNLITSSAANWLSPGSPNILTTFTPNTHKFSFYVTSNSLRDFYFYFKE
jgi:hypothetical protein